MKWIFLILLFSQSLYAQDLCGPKVPKEQCLKELNKSIFFGEMDKVKATIKAHGIKILFSGENPYGIIRSAAFHKNVELFRILTSSADYPADVPDRLKFLDAVMSPMHFHEKEPEIIEMMFFHKDPSKRLTWTENPQWPYPLLDQERKHGLKIKDKEKERYKGLITYLNKIAVLRKDICSIKNVTDLEQNIAEIPGFETIFKISEHNLLKCAIESENIILANYLLEKNFFSPPTLAEAITKLKSGAFTKDKLALLSTLEYKMQEQRMLHPDSETKKMLWVFNNLENEVNCLEIGLDGKIPGLSTFSQVVQKVVFSAIVKEIEVLKKAQTDKNDKAVDTSVAELGQLLNQSGMPINYQDEEGRTLLHHIATFASSKTIDKLERVLNNKTGSITGLQDKDGNTPVHIAIIAKNFDGASAFVDKTSTKSSQSFTLKNKSGLTSLEEAQRLTVEKSQRGEKKKVIKLINEHLTFK